MRSSQFATHSTPCSCQAIPPPRKFISYGSVHRLAVGLYSARIHRPVVAVISSRYRPPDRGLDEAMPHCLRGNSILVHFAACRPCRTELHCNWVTHKSQCKPSLQCKTWSHMRAVLQCKLGLRCHLGVTQISIGAKIVSSRGHCSVWTDPSHMTLEPGAKAPFAGESPVRQGCPKLADL